jgi:riboflavin biosynthesis pyrimidine reductase
MTGRGGGLPIERLWAAEPEPAATGKASDARQVRGGDLPPELAARFRDRLVVALHHDRPTLIANFVASIDGVVALGRTEHSTGGGEISGHSDPDRFVMALLRGVADAVVVGAGTVRIGRNHEWTARKLQPEHAAVFARSRAAMGLAPQPTTVVVTASGNLDLAHAGLRAPDVPVIVLTTNGGAARLATLTLPPNLRVVAAGGARISPRSIVELLAAERFRLALCEGGPHLLGELLAASRLDELFLTVAPQLIGRPGHLDRLGLVEGVDLMGATGSWGRLAAVHRAGDDLFLRYRLGD